MIEVGTWSDYEEKCLQDAARKAKLLSFNSNCKKLQVGAVILDAATLEILSEGWNRLPKMSSREKDCSVSGHSCFSPQGCKWTIHAEQAAVLDLPRICFQGIVVVCTHYPCLDCLKLLIEKGLTKVYYMCSHKTSSESEKLLKWFNIEVLQIDAVL